MAELIVEKTGFDGCYDALINLSAELNNTSGFSLDLSDDISLMGDKERECYEELLRMIKDLAALAEETAKDVKLSKARYVLADQ